MTHAAYSDLVAEGKNGAKFVLGDITLNATNGVTSQEFGLRMFTPVTVAIPCDILQPGDANTLKWVAYADGDDMYLRNHAIPYSC
jgi:hypothetical protein